MVSVMAPSASTMMRQDSIHVVVVFFGLSSGSKEELPPLGSRQLAMPMPASRPEARSRSRSASSASQPTCVERLGDDRVVVAAVVGAAAGDQVGELVGADEIAPPHLEPVEPQRLGDAVDAGLDGVVGGGLAEAAHGLLRRLVGGDGDGVIGDAP